MDKILDAMSSTDQALGACYSIDFRDAASIKNAMDGLMQAMRATELMLDDQEAILSIHDAVFLVNHIHGVCKQFIIMNYPDLAVEAFRFQYLLPAHTNMDSAESDVLLTALKEKLDDLTDKVRDVKQQEPFIDTALSIDLGTTPAASALRSQLFLLKAEILIRDGEVDSALFSLMESYASLADSVSQKDSYLDQARLRILRNIRRCLEAKDDPHLASWVQRKVEIIKTRNEEELDSTHESATFLPERWPCAAFAMRDANAAYDHLKDYKCVKHYGEGWQGHYFFTWDDGYRHLGVCPKCHGYILVQRSEYHGEEDSYYGDYFPVSGPKEAEALNEQFDGWEIEDHFPGRYLIENGGPASWYELHLKEKADQKKSDGDA